MVDDVKGTTQKDKNIAKYKRTLLRPYGPYVAYVDPNEDNGPQLQQTREQVLSFCLSHTAHDVINLQICQIKYALA